MSKRLLFHRPTVDVLVEWDDRPKRSAKPCSRCGRMTQGRMFTTDHNTKTKMAVCIDCCIVTMKEVKPTPQPATLPRQK